MTRRSISPFAALGFIDAGMHPNDDEVYRARVPAVNVHDVEHRLEQN
jgi:hypothetical protein